MQGWIKLHRKIRENPIFNNSQLLRLWLICLTEASHKEHTILVGTQTVTLKPGEFVTGRFDLQEMYNSGLKTNEKVKGEKTVFRWLESLEKAQYLTIKKTNKFSVVSINNWSSYQQDDQQMTNKRPTDDQQMTTNKNVKNGENGKKKESSDLQVEFEEFWNIYKRSGSGKKKSYENFLKARKKYPFDVIKNGAVQYMQYCKANNTEQKYIKLAETFLSKESFNDHYEIPRQNNFNQQTPVNQQTDDSLFNHNLGED